MRAAAAAARSFHVKSLQAAVHLSHYLTHSPCFLLIAAPPACRHHAFKQRQLRAAAAAFMHSCQRRAWLSWRAHIHTKQLTSAKLQHAVAFWAGNTAAQAWHQWRGWAAASRHNRLCTQAAGQQYYMQLQQRALLALWGNMARRREQGLLAYQVEGHMNGFRWACTFGQWAARVEDHGSSVHTH